MKKELEPSVSITKKKERMKKEMKKMMLGLLCAVLVLGVCQTVEAENTTAQYLSGPATAGQLKNDGLHSLAWSTNMYDHICGGDTGVWFYVSENQLSDSFTKSTSRKIYIYQYEADEADNAQCRSYVAHFLSPDSCNAPTAYTNPNINSMTVETDGSLELFIMFRVTTDPGDYSTAVTSGLLKYRFWTW